MEDQGSLQVCAWHTRSVPDPSTQHAVIPSEVQHIFFCFVPHASVTLKMPAHHHAQVPLNLRQRNDVQVQLTVQVNAVTRLRYGGAAC